MEQQVTSVGAEFAWADPETPSSHDGLYKPSPPQQKRGSFLLCQGQN